MPNNGCIVVKFSEGLGIFDQHSVYPQIDEKEIYEGPTGKVIDVQGIQAHAGRNFFVPEGKEFSLNSDQCPYLQIAIKAEPGTNTCLFLLVHERKHDWNRRFVVIGKTPHGDCRRHLMSNYFTIEDDNTWHQYVYDLRKIREEDDDNIYHQRLCQDAGSIREIQFYSWSGSGRHTFHFNCLLMNEGIEIHKKMLDKLSDSFFYESLPILEREYDERYKRMTKIFKEMITSETEVKEFFESPVNYLKKHNALIMETVRLPNGEVIPMVDDKVLADTIMKARGLYKEGIIGISDIQGCICYETKSASWNTKRSTSTHSTRQSFLKETTSKDEANSQTTEERVACYKDGKNAILIDSRYIGPLVDPVVFKTLREMESASVALKRRAIR